MTMTSTSSVRPQPLTEPQRRELTAQRDKGPQHTYGRHRTRTQNVLVDRKLSEYTDCRGQVVDRAQFSELCQITALGIGALCGCGGFVRHGAFVHADSCSGEPGMTDRTRHRRTSFKEGVVLDRTPFKVNEKLVRESLARADARDAVREFQAACGRSATEPVRGRTGAKTAAALKALLGREECMIVVAWTALRVGDKQQYTTHTTRHGEVSADLGIDKIPDPPFTDSEMQQIAYAAKMAALTCIGARSRKRGRR